jgi:hypothetical protein
MSPYEFRWFHYMTIGKKAMTKFQFLEPNVSRKIARK